MPTIHRPLVLEFKARDVRSIAAHVRAGGHAVVWQEPGRAHLVLPRPKPDDAQDLAAWSLYDLRKERWKVIERGLLGGLITTLVPRDCLAIVRRRIERDRAFSGATTRMRLDCLKCGACCRDNQVTLSRADIERFRNGGRPELAKPPFARRVGGVLEFRLLGDKRCQHLGSDNRCAIYALRPEACSTFPMGSECCLFARELELGIREGKRQGGRG